MIIGLDQNLKLLLFERHFPKMKRHWQRRHLQSIHLIKDLYLEDTMNSENSIRKSKAFDFFKWDKQLNRLLLPKEDIQMAIGP